VQNLFAVLWKKKNLWLNAWQPGKVLNRPNARQAENSVIWSTKTETPK